MKRLTDDPAGDFTPFWSPGGTQLVFISDRNGARDVFVMDSTGFDQRPLTDDPGDDFSPTWSPDGDWIVYQSREAAGEFALYALPAPGAEIGTTARLASPRIEGNSEPLTVVPDGECPSFSGDAFWLAFCGLDENEFYQIRFVPFRKLLRPDGNPVEPIQLTDSNFNNWAPMFQPRQTNFFLNLHQLRKEGSELRFLNGLFEDQAQQRDLDADEQVKNNNTAEAKELDEEAAQFRARVLGIEAQLDTVDDNLVVRENFTTLTSPVSHAQVYKIGNGNVHIDRKAGGILGEVDVCVLLALRELLGFMVLPDGRPLDGTVGNNVLRIPEIDPVTRKLNLLLETTFIYNSLPDTLSVID